MAIDINRFEQGVCRENTGCIKWDLRDKVFGTADVIPLWVADMDFAAPDCVTEAIIRRAQHGAFGYCTEDPADKQAVIDWMKNRHGLDLSEDDILFSPGVIDSMVTAISALGEKGEAIAMFTPVYGPFYRSTEKNGLVVRGCRLIQEGSRWTMDLPALEEIFREGVKFFLLCNPHNPVGRIWTRDELNELVKLTRKYGVTIISDEIHADLEMPGYRNTSILCLDPDAIVFISATKTFNLAALKHSSVLIKNAEIRAKVIAEFEERGNGGVNMFGRIAQTAAYQGGAEWLDALLAYLAGTRDAVVEYIAKELPEVKVANLEGTYLMWLDFRCLGLSQEELEKLMIEKAGLGMNSGTDFGADGAGFMRLNIATPRWRVMQALEQLKAACTAG